MITCMAVSLKRALLQSALATTQDWIQKLDALE
jgi:hypothetical protein